MFCMLLQNQTTEPNYLGPLGSVTENRIGPFGFHVLKPKLQKNRINGTEIAELPECPPLLDPPAATPKFAPLCPFSLCPLEPALTGFLADGDRRPSSPLPQRPVPSVAAPSPQRPATSTTPTSMTSMTPTSPNPYLPRFCHLGRV